jgi:6-phosphogluconate dehydrogenase
MTQLYELGMVGLGVMGRRMMLEMADHGFAVAGYDKDPARGQELLAEGANKPVAFAGDVASFVALLKPPRVVMLLVAPASVVDRVLADLLPHLQPDDLVIDASNSFFKDTRARGERCAAKGVRFFGMGVSGGEAGARQRPSLMPGGPQEAYERVRPVLEAVAARVQGEPCVAWVGRGAAGHYVKMVHDGIEYGLMQLIAESYDLLKRAGLRNDELAGVFDAWNKGDLHSFLIEITATVLRYPDDKGPGHLVDKIKDATRQKGTGQWTSQDAFDLQVPIPTIDAAVRLRELSGQVEEREAVRVVLGGAVDGFSGVRTALIRQVGGALFAASVSTYAQGLDLLRQASKTYDFGLQLGEIARIWRGGCIIRAALLEDIRTAYAKRPDLPNLLADGPIAERVKVRLGDLRAVVATAAGLGVPAAGFMTALAYVDALRVERLPTNLIQGQRDLFGAHTYERVDAEGTFHTHWGA